MSIKKSIQKYCESLGLDEVGFCRCRVFHELRPLFEERKAKSLENEFEEEEIEKRINPFNLMEDGKTIISIAFPYMHTQEKAIGAYFSKYTHGLDYHKTAEVYMKKICSFIESLGGRAVFFVDSNALPERYIAHLAGVGFIGKNNLIINHKYGSYLFLGEIITDLAIEEDDPKPSLCRECDLCLRACPTGAIGESGNNPNICMSYITQKKDIEEEWFDKLNGRVFGCDTCQIVCPFNKAAVLSTIEEFKPRDYMQQVNLGELINIDNKTFREKYAETSCGWRGKNILKRNALIAAARTRRLKDINLNSMNSPYIKDYYNRLLKHYNL